MLKAVPIDIPIIHLGYKSFASVCRQKLDLGFLFLLKGRVKCYKKDVPSSEPHEIDRISKQRGDLFYNYLSYCNYVVV